MFTKLYACYVTMGFHYTAIIIVSLLTECHYTLHTIISTYMLYMCLRMCYFDKYLLPSLLLEHHLIDVLVVMDSLTHVYTHRKEYQ